MTIEEKIRRAENHVSIYSPVDGTKTAMNDAANIYADSYEEYMEIWDALQS